MDLLIHFAIDRLVARIALNCYTHDASLLEYQSDTKIPSGFALSSSHGIRAIIH